MIRSIPPGRKPSSPLYKVNVYSGSKRLPYYSPMRISTLESLLAAAERLESEQIEIVKLLPHDEELNRLDKLQLLVRQLKTQIALRTRSQL